MDKTVEQEKPMDRTKDVPEVTITGADDQCVAEILSYFDSYRLATVTPVCHEVARHRIEATREVEAERVKLWNENRDLIASIHVEKAATDTMRAQLDEAMEAGNRLLQYEGHQAYCGHGNDMSKPCVCGYIDAQDSLRRALTKPEVSK